MFPLVVSTILLSTMENAFIFVGFEPQGACRDSNCTQGIGHFQVRTETNPAECEALCLNASWCVAFESWSVQAGQQNSGRCELYQTLVPVAVRCGSADVADCSATCAQVCHRLSQSCLTVRSPTELYLDPRRSLMTNRR